MTGGENFGNVTSVAFGDVTSIDKMDFFGDVTANRTKGCGNEWPGNNAPKEVNLIRSFNIKIAKLDNRKSDLNVYMCVHFGHLNIFNCGWKEQNLKI